MNIVERMKTDWNRRATGDAKFWVDTSQYQNDEVFDRAGEKAVTRFLGLLAPFMKSSWHVLDVGCGIGRMVKPMASHFEYVRGADVSKEMISKGQQWLKGTDNAEIFENNGVDLKLFESSKFDLVYSCLAFQHMAREVFGNYLSEINRVLKPNGFLEFQMCVGSYRDPSFEDTLTIRVYKENELLDRLESHGFVFVDKLVEPKNEKLSDWILLARKTDEDKVKSAEPPLWLEEGCQKASSALEIQLSFQLAKDYIASRNRTKAEKILHHLVTNHPDYLEAWFELSILLVDNGRVDDAIQTIKDMLDAHPAFYSGYFSLAELYKNSGHEQEIANVQKALRESQGEISRVLADIEKLLSKGQTCDQIHVPGLQKKGGGAS